MSKREQLCASQLGFKSIFPSFSASTDIFSFRPSAKRPESLIWTVIYPDRTKY